jgi:hypothetical protein
MMRRDRQRQRSEAGLLRRYAPRKDKVSLLRRHPGLVACAGLIAGPLAWAVASELGLILPYAECRVGFRPLLIACVLLLAVSAGSGWASWRSPWAGPTGRFTSLLCAALAASFAFAILLQALASALLTGCER